MCLVSPCAVPIHTESGANRVFGPEATLAHCRQSVTEGRVVFCKEMSCVAVLGTQVYSMLLRILDLYYVFSTSVFHLTQRDIDWLID